MSRTAACAAAIGFTLILGCGDAVGPSPAGAVAPLPRRMVVWLDEGGIDGATAARLRAVGVDELVVQRGQVGLGGEVPVLRLTPAPPVAGSIPVAMALEVTQIRPDPGPAMASAMWQAVAGEVGDAIPAEIILGLPRVVPGVAELVRRLSVDAGVPVVPVLGVGQLDNDEAARLVAAARSCIVPAYGSGYGGAGWAELDTRLPLAERLAPLAGLGVRVRLAISLHPVTAPQVAAWGEDVNPLTEPANASVSTSSALDRTFLLTRALDWSGRRWQAGERVAVSWMDAVRLNSALVEANRLVLPEVGGWDLISLPPPDARLGVSRDALISYLSGEGPAPAVIVRAERDRDELRVSMVNSSPFSSAVSGVGNWVEVAVTEGSVTAEGAGSFDRILLGTVRDGEWSPHFEGGAGAVRLYESYLGPEEELESGPLRLDRRRATCRIRWRVSLTSGDEISGELVSRP